MKRKVALLLAAIMAASPISLFASSTNTLDYSNSTIPDNSIFLESDWSGMNGVAKIGTPRDSDKESEYVVRGTTLKLELRNKVNKGDQISVELDNARWFFRNKQDEKVLDSNSQRDSLGRLYVNMQYYVKGRPNVGTRLDGRIEAIRNTLVKSSVALPNIDAATSEWLAKFSNPAKVSAVETLNGNDVYLYKSAYETIPLTGVTSYNPHADQGRILQHQAASKSGLVNNPRAIDESTSTAVAQGTFPGAPGSSGGYTYNTAKGVWYPNSSSNTEYGGAYVRYGNPTNGTEFDSLAGTSTLPTNLKSYQYVLDTTEPGFVRLVDKDDAANLLARFADTALAELQSYVASNNNYIMVEETGVIRVPYDKDITGVISGAKEHTLTPDDSNGRVPYILEVDRNDTSRATLTFLADAYNKNIVEIPVVSFVGKGVEAAVRVESSLAAVNRGKYPFATTNKAGSTTTFIEGDVIKSRSIFEIPKLVIEEKTINSIKDGQFTLEAPDDFVWQIHREVNGAETVKVYTDGDLTGYANGVASNVTAGTAKVNTSTGIKTETVNTIRYGRDSDGKAETNVMIVTLKDIGQSTRTKGRLYITNLGLKAKEDAQWGNVDLRIKNGNYDDDYNNGAGVTDESVKGLERADWKLNLKTITDVPTLVNGRYDAVKPTGAKDAIHKAATVRFEEGAKDSWWADRITVLSLSDGAKFRKVKIKESKNIDKTNIAGETVRKDLNGTYSIPENQSKQYTDGYVTLEASRLVLEDVTKLKEKIASFEMESWLSIESGVEGDVKLAATGSAIANDDIPTPVVIAKAVSPITIDTKVTDVVIGLQGEATADFTITETDKGMLQRDKQVVIFLDDEISGDGVAFAHKDGDPIKVQAVGDELKIRNISLDAGKIVLTVENASKTKPAAIKISNVRVKVDRTVPQSNLHPLKLIVSGSAVAPNGEQKSTGLPADMFRTKGIKKDYLNIVTSHNDIGNLATTVKVTVGSTTVIVGNNTPVEMDTAAFIDPESNSVMVPVRFVSQALGISKDLMKFSDKERTVTINVSNSKAIQFKIGTSELNINGVLTKMETSGFEVKSVIKDERSFLPMRWLGIALGIDVAWDDATKTATYNPDKMTIEGQKTEAEKKAAEEKAEADKKAAENK